MAARMRRTAEARRYELHDNVAGVMIYGSHKCMSLFGFSAILDTYVTSTNYPLIIFHQSSKPLT